MGVESCCFRYLLSQGGLLTLATRCPWDIQLLSASWAVEGLGHGILRTEPAMSCRSGESILTSLRNVVVESSINCFIDGKPWHAGSPEVFQSEANAILEVVSRIEHESMPDHEDIYGLISSQYDGQTKVTDPVVATFPQSRVVVFPFV